MPLAVDDGLRRPPARRPRHRPAAAAPADRPRERRRRRARTSGWSSEVRYAFASLVALEPGDHRRRVQPAARPGRRRLRRDGRRPVRARGAATPSTRSRCACRSTGCCPSSAPADSADERQRARARPRARRPAPGSPRACRRSRSTSSVRFRGTAADPLELVGLQVGDVVRLQPPRPGPARRRPPRTSSSPMPPPAAQGRRLAALVVAPLHPGELMTITACPPPTIARRAASDATSCPPPQAVAPLLPAAGRADAGAAAAAADARPRRRWPGAAVATLSTGSAGGSVAVAGRPRPGRRAGRRARRARSSSARRSSRPWTPPRRPRWAPAPAGRSPGRRRAGRPRRRRHAWPCRCSPAACPAAVLLLDARTAAAPSRRRRPRAGRRPPPPPAGVELLHGVAMEVTVELGRTRLSVRELLALTPGDVLELDRAAGSPADLLVNGRLIARGEVVVRRRGLRAPDHRDRRPVAARAEPRGRARFCAWRSRLGVVLGLIWAWPGSSSRKLGGRSRAAASRCSAASR